MKTTGTYQYPEPIKGFHTVEFFRKVKRQISREIKGMTDAEYRAWSKALHEKYAPKRAV